MPESELVSVLCFDDTVLLDWNLDSLPLGWLLAEDREMVLFKEFELVVDIVDSESYHCIGVYTLDWKVEPCFVWGFMVGTYPQVILFYRRFYVIRAFFNSLWKVSWFKFWRNDDVIIELEDFLFLDLHF
jgi:hypothetical protein